MDNSSFYDIVDDRISQLMNKFKDSSEMKKRNTDETKRSYMFMLWFLERYLPDKKLSEVRKHIVDGSYDNSCDLIFDNVNSSGERIFYVVQSKWFKKSNMNKSNKISKEIKACLEDYKSMLFNNVLPIGSNEEFKLKYEELKEHQQCNGKIRFLFITLCRRPNDIDSYLNSLSTDLSSAEILDINRLKMDYIEFELKRVKSFNPLELPHIPEGRIDLQVEESNFIKVDKPYKTYIFLIKPQIVFDLVTKFGFSLFAKNLRNPLLQSSCNYNIEKTLREAPENFWYFNNGITAITNKVKPFYTNSKLVTIENLQVINGAQTVYSIYKAYSELSDIQRQKVDDAALVTFRIIESKNNKFNFNVTRFTNSQNIIISRDFHSNDDIQLKLQRDFAANTDILYETRRGEYRTRKDLKVVSNLVLGQTYLAYSLQEPLLAKSSKAKIFVSRLEDKEGLYEKVYNAHTRYDDMLASYYLFKYIEERRKAFRDKNTYNDIRYASFELLALFNFIFNNINRDDLQKSTGILVYQCKGSDSKIIESYYNLSVNILKNFLNNVENTDKVPLSVVFKRVNTYKDLVKFAEEELNSLDHQFLQGMQISYLYSTQ